MGVGRGVRVPQRLVGDQQMPGDHLQIGGIPVERPVGHEHHSGPVREGAVEIADLTGDRTALIDYQHLQIGCQRRQPAAGGAAHKLVVPLPE